MKRVRVDELLVRRGLALSRHRAKALVLAGVVVAGDHRVDKVGQRVVENIDLRLKGDIDPYVSRGGRKLRAGLDAFGVDPADRVCMDVGASTGGFTDCLLRAGARRVYAVDVGYGQLAWSLQQNPRVVNLERTNIRTLATDAVPETVSLVVIDASFISLRLVLGPVVRFLGPSGEVVALVKPQFEVGRDRVGKGGVVRDPALHREAVDRVVEEAVRSGFDMHGETRSPVPGAKKGNEEFLIHLKRTCSGG